MTKISGTLHEDINAFILLKATKSLNNAKVKALFSFHDIVFGMRVVYRDIRRSIRQGEYIFEFPWRQCFT